MKNLLKGKVIGVFLVAAFILGSTAVLGFAISLAQDTMDKEVIIKQISNDNTGVEYGIPDFPVNERGQTFGSGGFGSDNPDLILATGDDGTIGYVLRTDLFSYGPSLDEPQNPEEALIYMKQFEELVKEAQARGAAYVYYIPLYDSDGQTIIGKFGMGAVPSTQPPIDGEKPLVITKNEQSLEITYEGHVVRDCTITVDETVRLQVRRTMAESMETSGDIIWVSNNQSIFLVEADNLEGTEATITGIGRGSATLAVIVGEIELTCTVRVR
ncbi:MAG: hypothetical protein LBD23_05665 [Oscillospiraceae bacterium]|jgi:hypothetical protein|nr:hypothetical protein [Oscillospiraceae bacterium]